MGRRKRQFLDDSDSDSNASERSEADFQLGDNDPDTRDERALFEDPYRHKRRRRDEKEAAIYGVFGDDSDDEGYGRKGDTRQKKTDWAKAPTFVSGDKVDLKKETDDVEAGSAVDDEVVDGTDAEESPSDSSVDEARDEEEEKEPEPPIIAPAPTKPGLGASAFSNLPTSFGATSRTQRVFLRSESSSGPSSQRSTPLPTHEQAHFHKIGGSLGAQMLAKMGWKAGTGLGASGEGIIIPVESKLRPKNVGIAYKGFREKTEQSKLEAKRRGEIVGDDEELPPAVKKAKAKRSDVWKQPRKVKTRVEHKTYEQIVAEAGQEPSAQSIGPIIDATGREVSIRTFQLFFLADVSALSPANWLHWPKSPRHRGHPRQTRREYQRFGIIYDSSQPPAKQISTVLHAKLRPSRITSASLLTRMPGYGRKLSQRPSVCVPTTLPLWGSLMISFVQ